MFSETSQETQLHISVTPSLRDTLEDYVGKHSIFHHDFMSKAMQTVSPSHIPSSRPVPLTYHATIVSDKSSSQNVFL